MTISRTETEYGSRRYRDAEEDAPAAQSATPTRREPAEARHAPRVLERSVAMDLERQPVSSDYLAFLSNVAAPRTGGGTADAVAAAKVDTDRDTAVKAHLDAVRDSFSGPYVVDGNTISAPPMFRMTTHQVPQAMAAAVDTLGARAGVRSPISARFGQPTARDLVTITQALIDAGRLPAGPGDVATRIRRMQWDHGIGVDCAGYSKQALIACSARLPRTYAAGSESFRDLDTTRARDFAKVPLEKVRPGDLITLDSDPPGGWGHNVVVYSHTKADAAQKAALGMLGADVRERLASPGPHHVFEVDSSWGAGTDGDPVGGYRRDLWLYDESTKTWGSFEPGSQPLRFRESTIGPAEDKMHGAYRPR